MWKMVVLILILVAIAVGLNVYKPKTQKGVSSTDTASTPTNTDSKNLVYAKNLEVPWALAFLPDKSMLVTERAGYLRLIDKDGNLLPNPIASIEKVKQTGESGLHGVAVHPDFSNNHYVYFYYTYGGSGDSTLNRVVRYKFENQTLSEEKIIVDKIPGAIFHDGGRIKFGPDGFLYITTGDALNPSLSQDKNSLAGKILRVTDEGQAAPGNPFNNSEGITQRSANLVYSYGHRNPQGITWDDQGKLWETEHGQTATDEVNLIEMGKNYGWPQIRGDEKQTGIESPKIHSGSSTWAPAGTAFFNGSIYFGGLRGQALFQVRLDNSELKEHFKSKFGRIRDVVLGPDNMLYITTSNRDGRGNPQSEDDRIIRIDPNQL